MELSLHGIHQNTIHKAGVWVYFGKYDEISVWAAEVCFC